MILALLLLLQASVWAGDEAQECGQCHGAEAASQASTPMAQALQSVQDAKILRDHPNLSYSDGKYSYSIRREGGRSIYSVTDGKDAIMAPIAWAFGFGTMGQTYVFERNGAYHETSVSFYSGPGSLDWTPGHAGRARGTVEEAAGRTIDPAETRRCFGCHSTGAVQGSQLRFESLVPGVRCGPCHGDATRHVAEMRTGKDRRVDQSDQRHRCELDGLAGLARDRQSRAEFPAHRKMQRCFVCVVSRRLSLRIQHYKIPIQNQELVSCRRIEAARTTARRYIIERGLDRVRASRDLTMEGIHVYIVPQPGESFSSGDHVQA